MRLYEIDTMIEGLIDSDTGEILDYEAFESLQMQRDDKIEQMALWYKNLASDAVQIKAEEDALKERRQSLERKAKSIKEYVGRALGGSTLKTAKVSLTYRKSEAVEVTDISKLGHKYIKLVEPQADKTAIKQALKSGEIVDGAKLVTNNNIQIK